SPTAAPRMSVISCAAASAQAELFGGSSAPRPRRACGLAPRSGSSGCFAGELDMHGVWSEVGTIRPADGAVFIDHDLAEQRLVTQRLEHFPGELAGKVDGSLDTIIEFDVKAVVSERLDPDDAVQ